MKKFFYDKKTKSDAVHNSDRKITLRSVSREEVEANRSKAYGYTFR